MDIQVENEIIIIGGNHHNMLGVIRALGEKGIYSNIIVTHVEKYAYVTKSKYVKEFTIISEKEEEVLNSLEKYKVLNKKAVLIPTSDFAAYVIDKNLNMLKKYFYVPSIKNKQGNIIKLMNKYNQYKLCINNKIGCLKSIEVNLNQEIITQGVNLPCIVKPLESIDGEKDDISICKNTDELNVTIKKFKAKGYKNALIQDYLEDKKECMIMGVAYNNQVIIPGIAERIRCYPLKKGTTSFGKIITKSNFDYDFSQIVNLIKKIGYNGLFDIDIFKTKGKFVLNEINFRNSGNSYALVSDNIYLAYIYVLLTLGLDVSNEKLNVDKDFYFIDENYERKLLLSKQISFWDYSEARKKTSSYFIKNKKDRRVRRWKYIYAIKRRIKK